MGYRWPGMGAARWRQKQRQRVHQPMAMARTQASPSNRVWHAIGYMVLERGSHRPLQPTGGFPRTLAACYCPAMMRTLARPIVQGREVTAISRQRELLILCARIGFNP
jgi:hypothetical protein